MSYHFDSYDQSLVIDGFQKGIADNPFDGIADMRNVNLISVPGEASVNFATAVNSYSAITTGTISAVNSGTDTITYTGATGLEGGMAVVFAGTVPAGITAGTTYWISKTGGSTFQVYPDFTQTSPIDITNTTTGATFTTPVTVNQPKYFTVDNATTTLKYWMVDALGQVWTNAYTTQTNQYWVYTGNNGGSGTKTGNGIVCYVSSDGHSYIFVFRNSCIDYIATNSATWVYGWNPTSGGSAAYTTLNNSDSINNPHEALVGQDNVVYYCDASYLGSFFEKAGSIFDPTNTATFTWAKKALGLPYIDTAQCLAELGTNLLVGGKLNKIYPWNRTGLVSGVSIVNSFSYPIFLAEYNVQKMVTVNTNTYIFVGNRGRIYLTNGTNANLYKKIPDHISGTVEPYFTWGGVGSVKNQLYFSALVKTNAGVAINQYGGLWAIDLDTQAIRLTNKLSYGTYAGYVTALIPNFSSQAAGTGIYLGWDNGSSGYGIDTTTSTPYTGSQASIDSDLIPIGTFEKPRDATKTEYRLTVPMVSGESVTIKTRLIFNTEDTGYTTTLTDSTVGAYSGIGDINFKNAQWVQFQIVLNSTASSPSYTRLKEIRLRGFVGPTVASSQQISV